LTTQALSLETIDIISPDHYARNGYPHREWALLRREAPVYWFDRTDADPFWAVTRHADIVALSRQPRKFLNGPRLAVFPETDGPPEEEIGRHLLIMDPPLHAMMRKVVSARFTPRALRARSAEIEEIAKGLVDGIANDGEISEVDFVEKVSSVLPLAVIADMLGVPRSDWKLLFRWTNETIGSSDPEYRRPDETPSQTSERARLSLHAYFTDMVEERKSRPRDDLVSIIANVEVDGRPISHLDLMSYYNLIVIAGNETTRNATSGGLLALIEHPGELDKLRRDPSLLSGAIEEIVRWTTPVIQFCRTAAEDVELRGQKIRAGEALCLFYPSANRDEKIFADPWTFRIERSPNPHLAFGIGEHFCLGANLARLEMRVMFRHLVERLEHVELAGPVERLRSSFLGGVKHMPIRYKLRPAA
jgi:cytochrome P450